MSQQLRYLSPTPDAVPLLCISWADTGAGCCAELSDPTDKDTHRVNKLCVHGSLPAWARELYGHTYIHTHTRIHTRIHTHMHTHIHSHINKYMNTYTFKYTYTHI